MAFLAVWLCADSVLEICLVHLSRMASISAIPARGRSGSNGLTGLRTSGRRVGRRFYSHAHRGWSRSREIVGGCGWAVGWGYPVCGAARRSVRVSPSVVRRSGSVRACGGVGWWRAARDADRFAGV